ncbi:MAG TPA: hypothetical protein VNB64_08375 [Solirubrobacteraceae bacterium]|nr:hypothetical protein [Solirubrobacteraceae bacterium]
MRRLSFLRRLPAAAWACAAIAVVNGALWAALVPAFQIPDEIDHAGYVQYVAERQDVPRPGQHAEYADDLALAAGGVPFTVEGRPTWSPETSREVHRTLRAPLDSRPGGTGQAAVNNPPLYYLLAAVPYRLAADREYYDRLYVMRLLSALLAGVTVLFTFLFVRDVLPRTRWAWTVGALAVAFQPVFGFMSGGVNNDNLAYAAGAAVLFVVARGLRRGLTPGVGAALGAALLAGLLAKSSFLGMVPGALLALGLMVWRSGPSRRRALLGALTALLTLALPFGLWLVVNEHVFDRVATTTGGFASSAVEKEVSIREQISYLWQYFLPALPWMTAEMPADYPVWETYFQGFVGRFGWFQYGFPIWVNWVALGVFAALAALAGRAVALARPWRSGRWAEALAYAGILGGFVLFVNVAGYRYWTVNGAPFEQTRYLFPVLALWGLFVAVAARGAGPRWGSAVGGFLVVVLFGHSLFAMLLTLSRYYA